MTEKSGNLQLDNKKLNHYFSLLSSSKKWKDCLEELFLIARDDVIFDNLVVYQTEFDTRSLEVMFAKSTGRGKSAEADASWGESIANRVIKTREMICEEPASVTEKNRLASPFLLGIPITPMDNLPGVLVLIRFGGPTFCQSELDLAEITAEIATSIIRRKLLEEFVSKFENIQSVSKLQADFISTISHELRSPLGFIKGYTTTLLRTDTNWDRETQKDFLEIIERETNHLTDLIEDLLDSSRLQSGQMKFDFHPIRIDSLIRDEVNRVHLTHPLQQIELNFEQDIPIIYGDSRKLAQVIDNILSNAIKYAPDSKVEILVRKKKDQVIINIGDKGPGIPEQYHSRIFTRFFRVPEQSMKAHGSGLGLFICKQIIEHHQGKIEVSSSEEGSIFSISLPLELDASGVTPEAII